MDYVGPLSCCHRRQTTTARADDAVAPVDADLAIAGTFRFGAKYEPLVAPVPEAARLNRVGK